MSDLVALALIVLAVASLAGVGIALYRAAMVAVCLIELWRGHPGDEL